nr:hypothetical protein [Burkholderia pseudomallei]
MRLDDDCVAGRQIGEQTGIAVPGRERAAPEHEPRPARHDRVALVHRERRVLALRLLPVRFGGNALQFLPCIGDGFERAILRVRAARLERHHERLSRGVHHAVCDLEARAIQPGENFETHASPRGRPGLAPRAFRLRGGGDELVGRRLRVADAERKPVWRTLGADRSARGGLVEFKGLVQLGFECCFAVCIGAFPVHFGARHLGERAPVAARFDRGERVLQRVFMLREQRMGHGGRLGER